MTRHITAFDAKSFRRGIPPAGMAGQQSKRICDTLSDGFDVEVFRAKDLKKKVGT